jgi:hypothetical protein
MSRKAVGMLFTFQQTSLAFFMCVEMMGSSIETTAMCFLGHTHKPISHPSKGILRLFQAPLEGPGIC